jgi:alcohol dehydrogenase
MLSWLCAMAHQLGGFYNLPHGVCNAVLLPHVCEFNLIACQDRYAKIAELMGLILKVLLKQKLHLPQLMHS